MVNNYHLKYFVDAVELSSLSKAAKLNRVSIPAISQAIKSLEFIFDTELLEHRKNSFKPTIKGLRFFEKSKNLLAHVDEFCLESKKKRSNDEDKIFFATNSALASLLFPRVLTKMKRKLPRTKITFRGGYSSTVKFHVESGKVDFGININNIEAENCHQISIFKGHYIGIKKKRSLSNQGYLHSETCDGYKNFTKLYRKNLKKKPTLEMGVESWEVILNMALQGIGIGLIPDFYLWNLDSSLYSIQQHPFEMPSYEINIYIPKNKKMSNSGSLFLEEVEKEIHSLSKKIKKPG